MAVVFDASVLIYVVTPNALAPIDPATQAPVNRCAERIQYLIDTLSKRGERIVIPTPALAEVLVKAVDAAADYLAELSRSRHFSIRPFDVLAAVEHADVQRQRRLAGAVPKSATRPKAKFDDQIFAIAKVAAAETVYSDDPDIRSLCRHFGIECVGIADLPLPPEEAQLSLDLPKD